MPRRLERQQLNYRWPDRDPFLEERPERTIERPGSGQQQVRAAFRPLHLLAFGEALADDGVHAGFRQGQEIRSPARKRSP